MAYDLAVRAEGDDSKLEALSYLLHSWGDSDILKPRPYGEEFNLVFDDLFRQECINLLKQLQNRKVVKALGTKSQSVVAV